MGISKTSGSEGSEPKNEVFIGRTHIFDGNFLTMSKKYVKIKEEHKHRDKEWFDGTKNNICQSEEKISCYFIQISTKR